MKKLKVNEIALYHIRQYDGVKYSQMEWTSMAYAVLKKEEEKLVDVITDKEYELANVDENGLVLYDDTLKVGQIRAVPTIIDSDFKAKACKWRKKISVAKIMNYMEKAQLYYDKPKEYTKKK